ncbi:MAG: inosine 5'-monophosphate dehydrogenase [Smithella sp. PtaU1.Bin162]|nr:MAG: inosine 5'-monophosphate dehydrogenase [Smithella sp. PtaU1.Bin162]
MIISMWMTRDLITIEPATLITEAAAIMSTRHIRRLPVIDKQTGNLHPVGIITATDILHAYPPHINPFAVEAADTSEIHITAQDIMSRALITVVPETPIEEAAAIMRNEKISTLLVVQKIRLVGLITESDIFRAFVSMLDLPRNGARITFEITNDEDTFRLIAPLAFKWDVHVASLLSVQQADRKLCMIRITGAATDKMIAELWSSGHNVINVLRLP